MADAGLFIGWGEVVRGREVAAAELPAKRSATTSAYRSKA